MEKSSLEYGQYYHLFNRGNNSETLFRESDNYTYFLALYAKYINTVCDTLAYCLMPNHFHFVIRIREESQIKTFSELHLFDNNKKGIITDKKPSPSAQFAHLFDIYSKSFNKMYSRTGSLFEHPFERRIIENEFYIQRSIAYVHENPVKTHLSKTMEEYQWSSYKALISVKPTHLNRELVMKIYGGEEYFILYHGSIPVLTEFEPNLQIQTSKRTSVS